ncbi:MAG TPA: diaminopimelate epimerase [Chitinophagales bacterium]|nr:diaminopimelate epimerase [Chitinophagales bacterium]
MKIPFEKYHGAGNDFILIDNRKGKFSFTREKIALICHRRFGIGADGLILIEAKKDIDFEMKYFNADGGLGSMCGNGGRCAVKFAEKHDIVRKSAKAVKFVAFDGMHEAIFTGENSVKLSMLPVEGIEKKESAYILNTGSPHFVKFVEDVAAIDVVGEGRKIRNSEEFAKEGINVNFVAVNGDVINMRTYERGVEDETLSCGTGTVGAALAHGVMKNKMGQQEYELNALGGVLKVYFNRKGDDTFEDVWLEGPVAFVFEGSIEV